MSELTSQQIIMKPLVTEKAVAQEQGHSYAFLVHPKATKVQIRRAVEEIYDVHVKKVNTATMQGRRKRYHWRKYITPEMKKAMVTIAENERIDII